ncbi:hypothetical protein Trydic_g21518 [Trypoxylus dichotomus]
MQEELIKVRPNAGNGLWLGFILPIAIITSFIKYIDGSSEIYHYCFVFSLGLTYTTILFIAKYSKNQSVTLSAKQFLFPAITIGCVFYIIFNNGALLCCYSGLLSTIGFYKLYLTILKNFPLSFTLGEALFCAQGFTIFLYSSAINLYYAISIPLRTNLQISTFIIQVGLLCLTAICYLTYRYEYFRSTSTFYKASVILVIFLLLLPLHLILRQSPLLWIFELITKDFNILFMFIYWVLCSSCAIFLLSKQIRGARKASTTVRKTFHILVILVFLPGLLFECTFVYLASGIALGVFIALEHWHLRQTLLRILKIPPLGNVLEDGFAVFSDQKDAGNIALTPMYLLVGCSLPLWVHPAPCDVSDSGMLHLLPLISGLLSVGVGDASASYVGTMFGKHKWSGSNKTIEGTIGCILSQVLMVYLLSISGYYYLQPYDISKLLVAIVTVSLIEAKTTQVDNLVLPLLMYSILL